MGTDRHLKVLPTVIDAGAGSIAREITIDAPPETVFTYFTDPAKHVRWQGTHAELDPRPGGRLRISFGPGSVAVGEYLTIEPPTRLVYTWGWAATGSSIVPPGSSTVEVLLEPYGMNSTRLRVLHTGLPVHSLMFHGNGWDEGLTALHTALAPPR